MKIGNIDVRGVKLGTSDVDLYLGDRILYKELEYIESTGQQIVATTDVYGEWNINNNYGYYEEGSTYKIEIKYYSGEIDQAEQAAIMSINQDFGPTIYHNTTNPKGICWKFPSVSLTYFENISPSPLSNRQYKLSDFRVTKESTVEWRCIQGNSEYNAFGIALFGRVNTNILDTDRKIKAKLYYCKIYKNNILQLDFIPVQTFKGDVGLYDKVNHKFIKSYEGTPFIAGPEV